MRSSLAKSSSDNKEEAITRLKNLLDLIEKKGTKEFFSNPTLKYYFEQTITQPEIAAVIPKFMGKFITLNVLKIHGNSLSKKAQTELGDPSLSLLKSFSSGDLIYGLGNVRQDLAKHLNHCHPFVIDSYNNALILTEIPNYPFKQRDDNHSKYLKLAYELHQFASPLEPVNFFLEWKELAINKYKVKANNVLQDGNENELNTFLKKRCKLGILWVLSRGKKIHFLLDGLDQECLQSCFNKEVKLYTFSELRFIYRNWTKLQAIFPGKIIFYRTKNKKLEVAIPPWEENPELIKDYSPKQRRKAMYDQTIEQIAIAISAEEKGSVKCQPITQPTVSPPIAEEGGCLPSIFTSKKAASSSVHDRVSAAALMQIQNRSTKPHELYQEAVHVDYKNKDFQSAIRKIQSALKFFEKDPKKTYQSGMCHSTLASCYRELDDYPLAKSHAILASSILTRKDHEKAAAKLEGLLKDEKALFDIAFHF